MQSSNIKSRSQKRSETHVQIRSEKTLISLIMWGKIDTKVERKISWVKDFIPQDSQKKTSQRKRNVPCPRDFDIFFINFCLKIQKRLKNEEL